MTLLVGDNTVGSYTLDDDIYAASYESFRSFTAAATGSVSTLHLYVADMWTSTAIKLVLRDASGNLLCSGDVTTTGSVSVDVSGQGASVTSGNTYYLGFIPNTGYSKPYNDNTNNVMQYDTGSTYAATADPANTGAPTLGKGLFAIWAEGAAGGGLTATKLRITHGAYSDEQYFTSTPSGPDHVISVDGGVERTRIPPIGACTVEVLDSTDTVLASLASNLVPLPEWQGVILVDPDVTGELSVLKYSTGGVLVTNDQVMWKGDHVSVDAKGYITFTEAKDAQFCIWDSVTGTYGAIQTLSFSSGRAVRRGFKREHIRTFLRTWSR